VRKAKSKTNLIATLASVLLLFQGCSSGGAPPSTANQAQTTNLANGDGEIIAAQDDHAIKVEVTGEAQVVRLLREDDEGLPHQKFLLRLSNGTTVLVAHDIKTAPRVPLNVGDMIRIHGEYIWNAKGGLIHWTHLSDSPRHESGWIEFNGARYQ
jgi:hypothetical protein